MIIFIKKKEVLGGGFKHTVRIFEIDFMNSITVIKPVLAESYVVTPVGFSRSIHITIFYIKIMKAREMVERDIHICYFEFL